MELGTYSISLAVKNIEASKVFHEKFGFKAIAGFASQNWLILKNGDHVIGLFQGMFERPFSDSTPAGTATLKNSRPSPISVTFNAS